MTHPQPIDNSDKNSSSTQKSLKLLASSSSITKSRKSKPWTRTSYFSLRQSRLEEQAPKAETNLFKNVCVYFTGVRQNQRKLERLVWKHGGKVVKVWYRRQVSHVIADNLALSKIESQLQAQPKHRSLIIKPTWILQSIQQNKLLPTLPFQLISSSTSTKPISSFFRPTSSKPP